MGEIAANVVGILLFVGMLALSAYGWRTIPEGARFRTRMGPTGITGSMSKKWGLFTWPTIGFFVILVAVTGEAGWLTVGIMAFLFLMQFVSVRATIGGG